MFERFRKGLGFADNKGVFKNSSIEKQMPLELVWNKQVNRLLELGFHSYLGVSAEKYLKSFQEFDKTPPSKKLDLPLLVDLRVPVDQQLKMAGISDIPENIEHKIEIAGGPIGLEVPYNIWTHKPIMENTKGEKEYFCNLLEVTSLFIHYPELFKINRIGALGSRISMGKDQLLIPYITASPMPMLGVNLNDGPTIMLQTRGDAVSLHF